MKKQTYTFLELLKEFEVRIPIIQRDYAHGRDNAKAKDVREGLIDSLWNQLDPKSDKELHLDFVYGRIDGACLIPFDGQQRLTTLFLFHRYLYEKEKGKGWEGSDEQQLLKKFSYATRPSARDFCEALCEQNIVPCIADISDAKWFDVSWLDDPTVKSMIRVLKTIHGKASGDNNIERLNRITFTLADMGKLNMGDTSYISMNSTGRPLTAWENFKASYLQFLHTKDEEANHQEKEEATKTDRKINTIWTDFFFEQSREKGETNTGSFDHLMMEMVQLYLFNRQEFIYDDKDKGHILEEKLEIPYPGSKHDKYIPFSSYKNVLKKHKLDPLFNFWDYLHNHKDKDEALWSWEPIWFRAKEKYKTRVWEAGKFSHKERVAFHACIRPFEHGDIDYETLGEWMRIIWNILENSQVDSVDTYKTYIKLVDELHDKIFKEKGAQIDSKEELWQRISNLTLSDSSPAKDQLAEEIAKCGWLAHDACTPGQLHTWESHPLLKGRIRYICQDNLDSYWDETPTKFYYLNCFYNNVCATQGLNRAKNLVILLLTLYNKLDVVKELWRMGGLTFPSAQSDAEWKEVITKSQQWDCLKPDILSPELLSLLNKQPESLLRNDTQDYIKSLSIIYPDILQYKFILWFKDNESYARHYKGQWRTTCKKLDTYSELQYLCDGAVDVRNSEEQYCVNRTVYGAYKISIANEAANGKVNTRIICSECFKKLEGDTFIEKLESLFKQPVDTQTGDVTSTPQ